MVRVRQTNRQAERLPVRQVDIQAGRRRDKARHAGRQIYTQKDRQTDRQTGTQTDGEG